MNFDNILCPQRLRFYPLFAPDGILRTVHKAMSWCLCLLAIGVFLNANRSLSAATLPAGFAEERINPPPGNIWTQALGIFFEPNGRMYVLERAGRVWIQDYGTTNWNVLVDIREEVGAWDDQGCLGFAIDPNFRVNGNIYLMYAVDRHHLMNFGTPAYDPNVNDYRSATIGRITRYTARASDGFKSVDYASRRVLVGQSRTNGFPILYTSHGVGSLVFGTDGTLLASCGDGASWQSSGADLGSAPETYFAQALADGIITPKENVGGFRSQLVDSLSGKILRIDPVTGDGVPSNPFFDPANPGAARSKVWALGQRNPFRMTLRPDSGSHVPADANPGALYIGDVGWGLREELNICKGPGQNFGWPTFEGVGTEPQYSTYPVAVVPNLDAPNPLFPGAGCSQYFGFNNLLRQNTSVLGNRPPFNNPCAPAQKIPASIPQFLHTPPVLDYAHLTTQARTWRFDGTGAAVPINVDAPGAPFAAETFGGNCSIAGVWYTGTDLPAVYRNSYFHADLGGAWIKHIRLDANDNIQSITNFAAGASEIVAMATHPIDGALYYITYPSRLFKISYPVTGNIPPNAVATADRTFGPGPLTVQLNGSASTDREGLPLTYDWDFGDGTEHSALANPVHVFNAPAGVPTRYDVTLTVRDSANQTSTATLIVSPNNTPPNVEITSPVHYSKYPMTGDSVYNLTANVVDDQSPDSQLSYEWRTYLRHNNHEHLEPPDTNHVATSVISPAGCDGINIYYYRVELTVTDPQGLSVTREVALFPDCGAPDSPPVVSSIPNQLVIQDQAMAPVSFSISDAETASAYLEVHATSSNPTLVPNSALVLGFSGLNRTISATPAPGRTGVTTISVLVNDGPNTVTSSFQLRVSDPRDPLARTVWQVGIDNNPNIFPYSPAGEFAAENGINDLAPGRVTRLAGDPQFLTGANPSADDDYYFAGSYPSGFNGLTATLTVPNDEPFTAVERAWTGRDIANRYHFILDPSRVAAGALFRLSFEMVRGGSIRDGVTVSGFGDHDMVVRLRNPSGANSVLFSQRVSRDSNIVVNFSAAAAGALAGPNTLEIVRTGPMPTTPNTFVFVQQDYLRLEALPTVNSSPVLVPPANQTLDELAPWSLTLNASDADVPAQTLTYSLVSGPNGLTVSPGGLVAWTPTELQGPGSGPYSVTVRVTDSGTPSLSTDSTFTITVREVNQAPVMAAVANLTVDELVPFSLKLSAIDSDLPAQALTYSRVSGPAGLVVSAAGDVTWTPTELQGPGSYLVEVRVVDNGSPILGNNRQFTITVNEVSDTVVRTLWQIGEDHNPAQVPFSPTREFSLENNRNDPAPGRVTRILGDPLFVEATNPPADDDFYTAGPYPAGFNGLPAALSVPNDEPPIAWERALTATDRTNRIHFVFDPSQVTAESTFRFNMEMVFPGSLIGGVVQPGFADHDIVIRLRNPLGAVATLYSQRVSQPTNIVFDFSATTAGAMAGANTLEIVRTGPNVAGVSYWILFDFLRLESKPTGNAAPVLATPSNRVVNELAPLQITLSATDPDLPTQALTYSLVNGPSGMLVSPSGSLTWVPTEQQGPGSYDVTVGVADNGTPRRSDSKVFNIQVLEVPDAILRSTWQIGTDDNPAVLPYNPHGEFALENGRNDARPGRVTRLPGDPAYVATSNPAQDDDFYFSGIFPPPFNGLTTILNVPNDEPGTAWERALTTADITNRLHFVLGSSQLTAGSRLRLSFEFAGGGSTVNGVGQTGFSEHDIVVLFRNGSGLTAPMVSRKYTARANLTFEFLMSDLGATVGPNSVEFIRTGPNSSGTFQWIVYDYVRVEALPPAAIAGQASARSAPPSALRLSSGVKTLDSSTYLTLTYDQPEPVPAGSRYVVETSTDLVHWTEANLADVSSESNGALRTVTVRDAVSLGSTSTRFLRLRVVSSEGPLIPLPY